MKNIISAFGTILSYMIIIFFCIQIVSASGQAMAAKEYKADVIAEIENSNFNANVIAACISQASTAGYELQIANSTYDEYSNIQTAEIILKYEYKMPLFGISETKTTRGIAR